MSTAVTPAVQLDWAMKDGLVTVTPQDQSRFCVKVRRAIEILRQAGKADEFEKQFDLLVKTLAKWIHGRSDVERAYLTHREGALCFVVVRTSRKYDDDFEDALSDLDYQIANDTDLDLIKMDAIGLPLASVEAVSSFLDESFTLEFNRHGAGSGPHSFGQ